MRCPKHISLVARSTEMQRYRFPNAYRRLVDKEIIVIKQFGRELLWNILDQLNWKASCPPEGGALKNYSKRQ